MSSSRSSAGSRGDGAAAAAGVEPGGDLPVALPAPQGAGGQGQRGPGRAAGARPAGRERAKIATLARPEAPADRVRQSQVDKKWTELVGLLADAPEMRGAGGSRRKLIVFTEHRDTLNYLVGKLRTYLGRPEAATGRSRGIATVRTRNLGADARWRGTTGCT